MEKNNLKEAINVVVETLEKADEMWQGKMKDWTPEVTKAQYEKHWKNE